MTKIDRNSPAFPVQQQLEAYNARDIDAFMRWWAPDCKYYAFPDQLLASGADAIRDRHVERFKEPDLHGKLLSRIVNGNLVIDHETVTRNLASGKAEVGVVCIYEVEAGKIIRAWFRIGDPV